MSLQIDNTLEAISLKTPTVTHPDKVRIKGIFLRLFPSNRLTLNMCRILQKSTIFQENSKKLIKVQHSKLWLYLEQKMLFIRFKLGKFWWIQEIFNKMMNYVGYVSVQQIQFNKVKFNWKWVNKVYIYILGVNQFPGNKHGL